MVAPSAIAASKSPLMPIDRKSTRLNSSHSQISYAVFCLKKKEQDVKVSDLYQEFVELNDLQRALLELRDLLAHVHVGRDELTDRAIGTYCVSQRHRRLKR